MSKDSDLGIGGACAVLLLTPVLMFIHLALDGWALSKLWLWFIAEPFEVPALTIAHCIGISMLVAFAIRRGPDLKEDDKEGLQVLGAVSAWVLLSPPLVVLTGWIVKNYFMV